MSINGSISGISFGGLSSGIDTDSIISRLLQLEALPLQQYQARLSDVQTEQSILGDFKSKLQALSSAASTLNSSFTFGLVKGTSSATDVASITGSATAPTGIYNLTVTKLAQAHKISSAAQTDTTSALNQSGTMVVDGKVVTIVATDTLTTIAQKINSAGAPVTASIIDGGTGRAYLTLAATNSGVTNKIQIADMSGSTALNLGLVSGTLAPRETITNGYTSFAQASSTQTLDQLFPSSGLVAGSFTVNGQTVSVDPTTDTLQTLAAKVTGLGGTITGSVRTLTDSAGNKTYKLDIMNSGGSLTFTDNNNFLRALGVMQRPYGSELVQAQDAQYSLDGVSLTSSTNTITSAIPGATLTLLRDGTTTAATSKLTLSRDTDAIKQKIKDFADAYNGTVEFINANSKFDKDSFATGPLFGDPVALQVENSISNLVFGSNVGSSGNYHNLAAVGFGIDDSGKLTVDDAALNTAITTTPDALAGLFQTAGSVTGSNLSYIYSGSATKAGTYNVNVTSAWQTASFTATRAQTSTLQLAENLTFNGTAFGSTPVVVNLASGLTQDQVISQINADSRVNSKIVASADATGHLVISGKGQGAAYNFTVASDQTASGNGRRTQIGTGTSTDGTLVTGVDMVATINGEPTTISGNMITGNSTNANTAGLQIQYTGTATGLIGTVTVKKPIAAQVVDMMTQFTDPINGLLSARGKSLTDQQTDIQASIDKLQTSIQEKSAELKAKFAAMEQAIAAIQQQAARIQSIGKG